MSAYGGRCVAYVQAASCRHRFRDKSQQVARIGLSFDDSAGGAHVSAGTAAGAGIGVDFVDVAFGNSSDGAFADAGSASSAGVCDFVSHFISFF